MALPGFRDFYPDDCAFRNALFAKWRDVAHRYGFVEYDGPPLTARHWNRSISSPKNRARKSSPSFTISRTKATATSLSAPR
jgi:hypothetical protein